MQPVDIQTAHSVIQPYIHRTPVLTSSLLNDLAGCELFFKCENFQKAGAFKSRGAVNAVMSLDESIAHLGVATHSSGNHGAALARAAKIRQLPAHIVVPANAKQVKKDAIRGYGAQVIECEPTLIAREQTLQRVVEQTGASFVPPYDDERIIAGQGTVALEMLAQIEHLDQVVVPVGGGGLLAGCLLGFVGSGIAVYGAEPEGADDAYRSVQSGNRVKEHQPDTLCDGLLTTLGASNFGIIKDQVTDILLVSDVEVIDAMALIWSRMKIVVEPSSAITLAAVLRSPKLFSGRKVGCVLTGGNIDLGSLPFADTFADLVQGATAT
jgi:threonine dehydratase